MKDLKKNNEGFSLIELLLSIVILAIIVVPLLNNFSSAARLNARSKKMQNGTLIAQNLLESLKAESIEEISKEISFPEYFKLLGQDVTVESMTELARVNGGVYQPSTPSTTMSEDMVSHKKTFQFHKKTEVYYFALNGIKQDGLNFHALVTMDMKPYKNQSNHATNYNDFQMPDITEIKSEYNAVISKDFDEDAVESFWSMNVADCSQRSNDERTYYPLSKEEIYNNTSKNIEITIIPVDLNYFNVLVEYRYTCKKSDGGKVPGTAPIDYTVYMENIKVESNKKNQIYVFYSPFIDNTNPYTLSQIRDSVTVNNLSNIPLSLSVITQDSIYGTETKKMEPPIGYQMNINIDKKSEDMKVYSNLSLNKNVGSNTQYIAKKSASSGEYIEHNLVVEQVYDITVQIFDSNNKEIDVTTKPVTYRFHGEPFVTLHSTKLD